MGRWGRNSPRWLIIQSTAVSESGHDGRPGAGQYSLDQYSFGRFPSAGFLRRVFLRRGRLKTNPLRGLPRTDYIRDRNWLYQVTQGMLTRPDFFRTDT